MQFPYCDDESAVSVSCLDLSYSVNFKALKDAKEDRTVPVVLHNLEEEDPNSKSVNGESLSLAYYMATITNHSAEANLEFLIDLRIHVPVLYYSMTFVLGYYQTNRQNCDVIHCTLDPHEYIWKFNVVTRRVWI